MNKVRFINCTSNKEDILPVILSIATHSFSDNSGGAIIWKFNCVLKTYFQQSIFLTSSIVCLISAKRSRTDVTSQLRNWLFSAKYLTALSTSIDVTNTAVNFKSQTETLKPTTNSCMSRLTFTAFSRVDAIRLRKVLKASWKVVRLYLSRNWSTLFHYYRCHRQKSVNKTDPANGWAHLPSVIQNIDSILRSVHRILVHFDLESKVSLQTPRWIINIVQYISGNIQLLQPLPANPCQKRKYSTTW